MGRWMVGATVGALALACAAAGQDKGEAERAASVVTPLKVHIVVAKHLGDKKLGSLVYTFPCSTADRKVSLNLGVEVPVPVRKADKVEFQYRSVGTNIECDALTMGDGRFNLHVAFEQSSLYNTDGKAPGATAETSVESRLDNPVLFRTNRSVFSALLRDGQTTQAVVGTDPLTGETMTVDVTLTVLK